MIFHISNISVSHNRVGTIAERLVDRLTLKDIPVFNVDHFNNRTDGIFIVISTEGVGNKELQESKTEVEDAVVAVKNDFGLEHFSGKWIN